MQSAQAPSPGDHESSGAIDYRLARQALLQQYEDKLVGVENICDAHPELRRAGVEIGTPTEEMCPVCDDHRLMHVRYVFGPRLPSHGRCITKESEIEAFRARKGTFTQYVVEVCPACAWNHLVRSFVL